MLLDEMPGVLRRAGLIVEVCSDFTTNRHGVMSAVQSIACHHTAGPKAGDRPSLPTVRYGRPGLDGPLSQLFLSRSGVWVCVSNGLAWHAGVTTQTRYDNQHAIGIEAEATGVDPWPPAQYDSYARGAQALATHYRAVIVGHKEICQPPGRKIDPNFDMNRFRAHCASIGGTPPPAPSPVRKDEPMVIQYELAPGEGRRRFILPTGVGGSRVTEKAWVSFVVNGPRGGSAHCFFQTDKVGLADKRLDVTFNNGLSSRASWEVPAKTTQFVCAFSAPDGGVLCVETQPF